jgi:hypothetical protein
VTVYKSHIVLVLRNLASGHGEVDSHIHQVAGGAHLRDLSGSNIIRADLRPLEMKANPLAS